MPMVLSVYLHRMMCWLVLMISRKRKSIISPKPQSWQKKEADAMEAKILLAYLMERLPASSTDAPTDIYKAGGRQVQEWDGAGVIFWKPNTQCLSKKSRNWQIGSKLFLKRWNNLFPEDSRKEAHRSGLMVIYPSGLRYLVDIVLCAYQLN